MTEDTISDLRVAVRSKTYAYAHRLSCFASAPRSSVARPSCHVFHSIRKAGNSVGHRIRKQPCSANAADPELAPTVAKRRVGSALGAERIGGRAGQRQNRINHDGWAPRNRLSSASPTDCCALRCIILHAAGARGRRRGSAMSVLRRFPPCSSNRTCGFRVPPVAGCPQAPTRPVPPKWRRQLSCWIPPSPVLRAAGAAWHSSG